MASTSIPPISAHGTPLSQKKFNSPEELRTFWQSFLGEFANAASTTDKYNEYMDKLKQHIFYHGIPPETKEEKDSFEAHGTTTLRGEIWRILLRIDSVDIRKYTNLVAMQNSKLYPKIKGDTNRTFTQDAEFSGRVKEEKLVRVLNAFQHYLDEKQEKDDSPHRQQQKLYYSQGMNLFAGVFLFVMPEPLAFWAFAKFMEELCPRYGGAIEGAQEGLKLFEKVFQLADPSFHSFLGKIKAQNETYAYHAIVSLMLSVPPVDEAMKLFDVMLSWGVHLAVVFAVSNLILRRREFFDHPYANSVLNFLLNPYVLHCNREPKQLLMYKSGGASPPLNARAVMNLSWQLLFKIPTDLFVNLVNHPKRTVAPYIGEKKSNKYVGTS